MIEYYTVVYRVDGGKAQHDAWWQGLRPLFLADELPISITTIAKGDLIERLDVLTDQKDARATGEAA